MPDIAWWAYEDEDEYEQRRNPQPTPPPAPTPAPTPRPQPMAPQPQPQLPAWMRGFLGAPQQPQPYQRPALPMPPAQGPEALPQWAQSVMGALSPRNVTQPVEGMAALLSDIVTGRTSPMQFGQALTQEAGGGNVLDEIAAMWRMGQQRQQQMPVTMQDVADASRRYVAEPLQAALIQQNPLTRAAEALGLRQTERTQQYNPLSLLFPTIGMIVSDGRIDPARAYQQQQEYAQRQAPAERMAGTFAADPFGMPANIALTAIAPTAGVPAALYKAYKFLDTVDLTANILSADAPQLAAMGLGSVALKYGPGAILRALRTSIENTRFPTDDELAEAAARAWRESDARDYARAGQQMPETIRIVDAATGNVDTVPADVYYREVGRGAMKQARDGVTVGDKLRQWWAQETGFPAEARRFAAEETGEVRVPGAGEQPTYRPPEPDDIPYDLARRAHEGTSMVPEERARQVQQEYVRVVSAVEREMRKLADTPEKQAIFDREMERYRQNYLKHQQAILQAQSRTLSSMITGPSNFPTARNQKANDVLQKRVDEFLEWDRRARDAMQRTLTPEKQPISSDRPDAVQALEAKIAEAEKLQRVMVEGNKIVRKKGLSDEEKIAALIELGVPEKAARGALEPDFSGRLGFPSYALTNNNANIRRMKKRVEELTISRAQAGDEVEFDGGYMVDSVDDNRVQIFFDGKPPAEVRSQLKSHGFRWAPSISAWQRQRNASARQAASDITGAEWGEPTAVAEAEVAPPTEVAPAPAPAPVAAPEAAVAPEAPSTITAGGRTYTVLGEEPVAGTQNVQINLEADGRRYYQIRYPDGSTSNINADIGARERPPSLTLRAQEAAAPTAARPEQPSLLTPGMARPTFGERAPRPVAEAAPEIMQRPQMATPEDAARYEAEQARAAQEAAGQRELMAEAETEAPTFVPDDKVPLPINAVLAKAATKAQQKGADIVEWTSSTARGPEFRALELLRDMAKRGEAEKVGKHLRYEAERGRLEVWNEGTAQAPVVRVEAQVRAPEVTSPALRPAPEVDEGEPMRAITTPAETEPPAPTAPTPDTYAAEWEAMNAAARRAGLDPEAASAEQWERLVYQLERPAMEMFAARDAEVRETMRASKVEGIRGGVVEEGRAFGRDVAMRQGAVSKAEAQRTERQERAIRQEALAESAKALLLRSGYEPGDLDKASPEHLQKLLAEIVEGRLLKTPSGRVSKIDEVPQEARARALETATDETRAIAATGGDEEAARDLLTAQLIRRWYLNEDVSPLDPDLVPLLREREPLPVAAEPEVIPGFEETPRAVEEPAPPAEPVRAIAPEAEPIEAPTAPREPTLEGVARNSQLRVEAVVDDAGQVTLRGQDGQPITRFAMTDYDAADRSREWLRGQLPAEWSDGQQVELFRNLIRKADARLQEQQPAPGVPVETETVAVDRPALQEALDAGVPKAEAVEATKLTLDARRELERAGIPKEGIAQLDNTAVTAKQVREVRREVERATPERVEQAIAASEPPTTEGQAPLPGMGGGAGEPPRQPPEQGRLEVPETPDELRAEMDKLRAALAPEPKPSLQERLGAFSSRLGTALLDRNEPLRAVERESPSFSPWQYAKRVPRAGVYGDAILERHIDPIIRDAGKDGLLLQEYMVAMRTGDIKNLYPDYKLPQDIKASPDALRKAMVQEYGEERVARVEEIANRLWAALDEWTLGERVRAGLMTAEQKQWLNENHPHYIQYYRRGFDDASQTFAGARVADMPKALLKRLTEEGSEKPLKDPLAHARAEVIRTQEIIWINEAAKETINALEEIAQLTGDTDLIKRVPEGTKEGPDTGIISAMFDGERVTAQVPKEIAEVAKGLGYEQLNLFFRGMRLLTAPLRYGAVLLNIDFVSGNPIRDIQDAYLTEGLTPFQLNYWRSVIDMLRGIKGTEDYFQAAKEGAVGGGFTRTLITREALTAARRPGVFDVRNLKEALTFLPRLIMTAAEATEDMTRLAVYRKLRDEGTDWLERATRTADATVDFSQSGTLTRLLNTMWPFINPPIQQARYLKGKFAKQPGLMLARLAMLAVPLLVLEAWNRQWDSYKDVPQYVHDRNYVFMFGEEPEPVDPRFPNSPPRMKPRYRVLPKGYGVVLGTAPVEAALRFDRTNGEEGYAQLLIDTASSMGRSVSPVDDVSALGVPVASTYTQVKTNTDWFRGRDIVPQSEMTRPPEERYGPETSKPAIAMGRKLKVSPRLIDFAIRDYFGGVGTQVMSLGGLVMTAAGYNPDAPGGAWRRERTADEKLKDIPGIGRFVGTASNERERQAYKQMDKELVEGQRLLYENPEVRRLGKGLSAPGNTVTVDGMPYEIPVEMRVEILRVATPLRKQSIDELVASPEYQAMTDIERSKEIDRVSTKAYNVARDYVLAGMQGIQAQDPTIPPGVQKQYEAYTAIPGYTAMMWDGRINAPRYLTITDAQAGRIQQVQQEIALIKSVAPRKLTDKQATILYALLTNDIEGAIMSLVQVRKNPERDRYWDAHPLLDEYYNKTVPVTDPTEYWQSLLPEMVRVPSTTPTERVPARGWAEVSA